MFVGAFIERPRATNGRPYGKHPYENEPKGGFSQQYVNTYQGSASQHPS